MRFFRDFFAGQRQKDKPSWSRTSRSAARGWKRNSTRHSTSSAPSASHESRSRISSPRSKPRATHGSPTWGRSGRLSWRSPRPRRRERRRWPIGSCRVASTRSGRGWSSWRTSCCLWSRRARRLWRRRGLNGLPVSLSWNKRLVEENLGLWTERKWYDF